MAKNYFKLFVTCTAMASSLIANAVERPPLPVQTLTNGEKYILFNYVRPDGYMSRTSWDGAVYYLGPQDSNYATYEFQAVENSNGTWSFKILTAPEVEDGDSVENYMIIPFGTDNLNFKPQEYAEWYVEKGEYDGYYKLKAGEGNNSNCIGRHLHLNRAAQYIVSSEPSQTQWYPDYYGGTIKDEYGYDVVDDEGYAVMADSISLNWAFVKASDITDFYVFKTSAYVVITNFEKAYLTVEGYETGFKNTVDAADALYSTEDFDEESVMLINELLNAKKAIYQEILKAKKLNTTEDAVLAASIETAMTAFNTLTETEALAAATQTLMDAEIAYQMGSGETIGLGKNMSFEDLSSQGGNPTTGISAAPAGWNLYLNGALCLTGDEIRAQGVGTWCGVNADCTGVTKDGNYGFGIWNQSIPETELSQTIEGLENGTYEVTAALMVGANGNGSRRTTQRIFGNLNSTYFASEGEYDLSILDNSEVYGFADLVELVTDTELQDMTVRAYVYDGTLTFGMRTNGNIAAALRTSSNGAGGDGWFKVDNFRIKKIGYVGEDAAAVANHYIGICTEYCGGDYQMQASVLETLEAKLAEHGEITAETPEADIVSAIIGMKEQLAVAEVSVKAYLKLYKAINQHYGYLDEYALYAGAGEYSDAIMDAKGAYDDGKVDETEINSIIEGLEAALQVCKLSGKSESYLNVIGNPSFEDMTNQPDGDSGGVADTPKGWTLILNGDTCSTATEISAHGILSWCAINGGDPISVDDGTGYIVTQQPTEGAKLWGIWNDIMPEVEISQRFENMPSGKYKLTADVMVQNNWYGDNITTQRVFANNYIQMFSTESAHKLNLPSDAKDAEEIDSNNPHSELKHLTYANYTCSANDETTALLRKMSVEFIVKKGESLSLGFRTNAVNTDGINRMDDMNNSRSGQGWFKIDNFELYYFGPLDESKKYAIDYYVDGEKYATDSVKYGHPIVPKEIPVKEGHTFSGWGEVPETMPAENIVVEGFFIEGYHDVAAGTLSEMFSGVSDVDSLTVSGSLNGTDISFIRSMPNLCYLDLSSVNIVSGGNQYNKEGNTTANNVVGDGMFAGLAKLRTLYLPSSATKVGQGVVSSETLRELHWSSNAAIGDGIVDDADAPTNMIVYAPSSVAGSYSGNIVLDGVAEEIVLTDEVPLHISSGFKAKIISYTRHFDKETVPHKPGGWESIILPFDVQSFVSEEKGDIAPFNSGNSGAKPFMLAALTNSGFAVSSAMKANVPYIIAMPNSSVYDDQDNISGNVVFMSQSAEGVPVLPTSAAQTAAGKNFDLVPAFETVERSFSVYALNDETYNDLIPGSAFVSGLREIRPFEAYASVESKPANAKTHFVIGDDGTATDIQRLYDSLFGSLKVECHNGVLYIFSSEVQTIGLYSSDGRLVRLMELEAGKNAITGFPEGVYFVGNKKVVLK